MLIADHIIKLIHIASMAVWFATPLLVTADVRRSVALGREQAELARGRADRVMMVANAGAVLTILTGLGLIMTNGGFSGVGPKIHAGFALALIALSVEFFVLKPAITKATEPGEEKSASKLAMFGGITHALKLTIMVLMVINRPG